MFTPSFDTARRIVLLVSRVWSEASFPVRTLVLDVLVQLALSRMKFFQDAAVYYELDRE